MSTRLFFLLAICISCKSFAQDNHAILAKVELKKKMGCINLQGKEVIPVSTRNRGSFTLFDINNKVLMTSKKYGAPDTKFKYGFARVHENRYQKSALMDLKGNIALGEKYDMVYDFEPTVRNPL